MSQAITSSPQAAEVYPDYAALWHLESIGILHALREGAGPVDGASQSRVAIIDTSVAVDHPCLEKAVNRELAIDFFSNRLGAFPYLGEGRSFGGQVANLGTDIADELPRCRGLLHELIDRLSAGSPAHVNGVEPTTSPDFSNHGTAIAGLVGARPVVMQAAVGYRNKAPETLDIPLPYCGADPFCELVPISTNFDTDPASLILALLYAELIDASVVLIPRSFPDPRRSQGSLSLDDELLDAVLPVVPTASERILWDELTQLIEAVSMRRPVVCAAGNFQEIGGIYPANLASQYNGIISVGAVNAKGIVSGYSTSHDITIMAPSNDCETYDRASVRLDEQDADFAERRCPDSNDNASFSIFEVVSTDVPGQHGYSHGPFTSDEPPDGLREFGSYFCRFGGTSAASAIIAGFLSLGHSLGRLSTTDGGPGAKRWLLSNSVVIDTDHDGSFHYPSWAGVVSFPDITV